MAPFTSIASIAALASLLAAPQGALAQTCSGVTSRYTPKMASGYRVNLLASGLRQPRHIVVDTEGNLLVAEGNSGTVQRLVLQEQGDIVCVASKTAVTTDRSTNHGISLSPDGKTLFTSNLASVTAYDYDATTGRATNGKVIVTGMSNTGTHPTRAILVSKSDPDTILVARGSNGNIDTSTTQVSSGRSMIRSFSISKGLTTTHDYTTGGELIGWGLRNIVGMGEDPLGGIWSVENSMDDVRLGGKDVHNENPAEKLNYHGKLTDGAANKLKGANFGYPSCVPAWDTALLGVANIKVGDLFKPDNTPAATDCASRQHGTLHFHSHTAPLDIKFTANGTAAYIAFHGSWNRRPADGYRVMRVNFKPDGTPVEPPTSKTAATPIMENSNTASCPGSCFRPVGLDFDKKGRLFVSSDSSGEVYVIYGA